MFAYFLLLWFYKIINNVDNPELAFEHLMPEAIARKYDITLTADEKRELNTLMLAIMS